MTDRQEKFVEFYARTGNATKAAANAGYSEKTAKQKGYELKRLLSEEIRETIQKHLQDNIPAALYFLSDLADNADSESVRLAAVRDILDREGLKPVESIETTSIERMSTVEIQRELDALLKH